jgi:hypothetical protein
MNDSPPVRRTFWHPIFLPLIAWVMLVELVLIVRAGETPLPFLSALLVALILGALFQLFVGLPLLSLFNRVRRFWSRVLLAGFAAMLVSCVFSFDGAFLEHLFTLAPPFMLGAAYTHFQNRPTPPESDETGQQRPLLLASWFGILLSTIIIVNLVTILRAPGIKTTSFDPWCASAVFLPTAVVSILARRHPTSRWTIPLACLVCVGGMALLLYVDHANKYLPYMEWMRRSQQGLLSH